MNEPYYNVNDLEQSKEVSAVKWITLDEAKMKIRDTQP